MRPYLLCFCLFIIYVQGMNENSDEFYDCINPDKIIKSNSECTTIKIPDSDGYKCCSMKISFNKNSTYSCFALENEFTKSQKIFNEYFVNRSIASLFPTMGGQIEIDCGEEMIIKQTYEKMSDEYLNCYNGHINGVQNENDCQKNDIPEKESCKCCFLESSQKGDKGNNIKDKRCYIIQNEYFTKEKNLNNYLLDKSKVKSLDQLKNINITISCKNYDVFYFNSKSEEIPINNDSQKISINSTYGDNEPIPIKKKESGTSTGIIVAIFIIVGIVLIGAVILVIYCLKKRKSLSNSNNNKMEENSVKRISSNSITNDSNSSNNKDA